MGGLPVVADRQARPERGDRGEDGAQTALRPAFGRERGVRVGAEELVKRLDAHQVEVDADEAVLLPVFRDLQHERRLAVAARRVENDVLAAGHEVVQVFRVGLAVVEQVARNDDSETEGEVLFVHGLVLCRTSLPDRIPRRKENLRKIS